jgi:hypothetical protein
VLWIGVNDATLGAATIYANIQAYCIAARSAGWNKIILCTEIDAVTGAWHGTVWPALNALIYANHSFVDGIADLGARVELQDATNLTYYNADQVHLVTAGYAIVGAVVGTALDLLK